MNIADRTNVLRRFAKTEIGNSICSEIIAERKESPMHVRFAAIDLTASEAKTACPQMSAATALPFGEFGDRTIAYIAHPKLRVRGFQEASR